MISKSVLFAFFALAIFESINSAPVKRLDAVPLERLVRVQRSPCMRSLLPKSCRLPLYYNPSATTSCLKNVERLLQKPEPHMKCKGDTSLSISVFSKSAGGCDRTFFLCVDMSAYREECAEGDYFEERSKKCERVKHSRCQPRPKLSTTTTPVQTTTTKAPTTLEMTTEASTSTSTTTEASTTTKATIRAVPSTAALAETTTLEETTTTKAYTYPQTTTEATTTEEVYTTPATTMAVETTTEEATTEEATTTVVPTKAALKTKKYNKKTTTERVTAQPTTAELMMTTTEYIKETTTEASTTEYVEETTTEATTIEVVPTTAELKMTTTEYVEETTTEVPTTVELEVTTEMKETITEVPYTKAPTTEATTIEVKPSTAQLIQTTPIKVEETTPCDHECDHEPEIPKVKCPYDGEPCEEDEHE